jgi:dihydroxyacetone kinase-like protein
MEYDSARFQAMFDALAQRLEAEKAHLCELDGKIGDGDHGIAMAQGFGAAAKALDGAEIATLGPAGVFNLAAKSFLNAVGASCGPLYATAFMRAGASLKGKQAAAPADVVAAFRAMAKGIVDRGKAAPGEKTMVDAWLPASETIAERFAAAGDLAKALAAAAVSARQGAEATRDMVAGKGRSSRLGERAKGHIDPGAASAAIVISVIAESLGR